MNNNIDNLKKRLIYRSLYRGTKEMDKLIGSFVRDYINKLDENDLKDLEVFLNYDDDTLYKLYKKELDSSTLNKTKIINLFINYVL
jgi:antitoxin CptB